MVEAVVCLKQVFDVSMITIDPDTNKPVTSGVPRKISDFDKNALEEAVKLKEAQGGSVKTVTIGETEKLTENLREALAIGADSSIALQDPLFEQPPYGLDRSRFEAAQPLLVLFMRKGCQECEDFHRQVLSEPEVRSTLEAFDVVQLDVDDRQTPVLAPDGSKLNPADWYAQSGLDRVPALVLFNESGEEVLSTDALVLKGRMMNSLNFTLERAYEKGWTYQRFARTKGIERAQQAASKAQ